VAALEDLMPRLAYRHEEITFRIDALTQGWHGLETAQRAREAELDAITGDNFESHEQRRNLIREIDDDTHAQVALMRAVVSTPASDFEDVLHKLTLLRAQTSLCCDGAAIDDLLASAMDDLQRMIR
jgi:hypothetical protein